MSSQILEFIAGNGIDLEANATDCTIKVTNTATIPANQKAALNNDKASASNRFITDKEMDDKLLAAINGTSANPSPEGFPKFITTSSTFNIPKAGKYKISAVGGGGSGSFGKAGLDGNPTIARIPNKTITANGGHGGSASKPISGSTTTATGGKPTILYDGVKGATAGGDYTKDGQNGAFNGGIGTEVIGGGGGSPLNYNTPRIVAEKAKSGFSSNADQNESPSPAIGYGAGGDGAHIFPDLLGVGAGAGGSSGYLVTETVSLQNNAEIEITIGAGGASVSHTDPTYHSGAGVSGAVLIEFIE